MKKTLARGAFVGVLLTAGAVPAQAAPAETETFHFKGEEETFVDVVPCVEPETEAIITTVSNGVFHITEKDGTFHVTGTSTGTFRAVTATTTYEGHFTIWFGENHNRQNDANTFTFNVTGRSLDGSEKINAHFLEHLNTSASEPPHMNVFFQSNCGQGNVTRAP